MLNGRLNFKLHEYCIRTSTKTSKVEHEKNEETAKCFFSCHGRYSIFGCIRKKVILGIVEFLESTRRTDFSFLQKCREFGINYSEFLILEHHVLFAIWNIGISYKYDGRNHICYRTIKICLK